MRSIICGVQWSVASFQNARKTGDWRLETSLLAAAGDDLLGETPELPELLGRRDGGSFFTLPLVRVGVPVGRADGAGDGLDPGHGVL
jgi:hypothetical protein